MMVCINIFILISNTFNSNTSILYVRFNQYIVASLYRFYVTFYIVSHYLCFVFKLFISACLNAVLFCYCIVIDSISHKLVHIAVTV